MSSSANGTSTEDTSNLWIKTCDGQGTGTTNLVKISFCTGGIMCDAGPTNEYNLQAEFNGSGQWTSLLAPLDYEPTTMDISKVGTDGWCIDALIWRNGRNLLGPCGRLYLDDDLGIHGCSYGVKDASDIPGFTPFPCGPSRRFYHLKDSGDHEYTMSVKPCAGRKLSPAEALFCSEPTCSSSDGKVSYDLSVESLPWATTIFSLNFNPSLIKITAQGDSWCAEEIIFNGYTLLTESNRPVELPEPGAVRYFFNFQREGIPDVSSRFDVPDRQGGIRTKEVYFSIVVTVVVTFVLVSFVTASFTNAGLHGLRITMFGGAPKSERGEDDRGEDDGGETRALAGKPPREFAFPEIGSSDRVIAHGRRGTRRSPWLPRGRSDSLDPSAASTDLPSQVQWSRSNIGMDPGKPKEVDAPGPGSSNRWIVDARAASTTPWLPRPVMEYPYPRPRATMSLRSESSGEGVELRSCPSSLIDELPKM